MKQYRPILARPQPRQLVALPGGAVTGTGEEIEVTDPNVIQDQPQRYYRLVELD